MGEFMSNEEIAAECARPILAGAKSDIRSECKSTRRVRRSELFRAAIYMYSNVGETLSKAALHPLLHASVERTSVLQLRTDDSRLANLSGQAVSGGGGRSRLSKQLKRDALRSLL
jgi:hypothetical protein